MKKLKTHHIAIISPEYPTYTNWGGVATFNYNLANLLAGLGHKVEIFTLGKYYNQESIENNNNLIIHYIPLKTSSKLINQLYYRFPFNCIRWLGKKYFPATSFSIKWNFFVFLYFSKIHKLRPFEIIHSPDYHFPALFIKCLIKNLKLIVNIQGPQKLFNQYERIDLDRKIKALLEIQYIKHCSHNLIACSESIKHQLSLEIPSLSSKCLVIQNFLDPEIYSNSVKINKNNIVFWGRLEYRKGVDLLINAFIKLSKRNADIKLFLIGNQGGSFKIKNRRVTFEEYFNQLVIPHSSRNRIHIFPQISDHLTLIDLLTRLKGIGVFPSRYEPFGYVNIESMTLGYITVSSVHGGSKEIIQDNVNGFTTEANSDYLSKKISYINSQKISKLNQISHHAKVRVLKHYSLESAAIQFIRLYRSL